jgi:hypothetical protein
MNRLINPEEHLQTKDIQNQIKDYAGCSTFTDVGQLCRPSFSTNKFTNPYIEKKIDCNWYCLRNCSPQKLLPIFKNLPKYIIEKDETEIPVIDVKFQFEPEITPDPRTRTYRETWGLPILQIIIWVHKSNWARNAPLWEWKDYRHYRREISEDTPWEGEGMDVTILAEQICRWFKNQDLGMDISLKCEVRVSESLKKTNFSRFNVPFLRPISEWYDNGVSGVTTKFIINKSASSQDQKITEPSVSSWGNLPTGLLGEEAEPLSSYGVAHPDIHRISRKHRKASHYRPRHFHSPTRKEAVNRKFKHRK